MNNIENQLRNALIDNIVRYLIDENFPRVIKCLEMLNEESLIYLVCFSYLCLSRLFFKLATN